MKLSDTTRIILKNFTGINEGLVFAPGKVQKTIDTNMTIMATATLEESFPVKAPIVELAKLLQNIDAFDSHNISFQKNKIEITDDSKSRYYSCAYGSEKVIKSPPDKTLPLENATNEIELSKEQFASLIKFASINNLPYISFVGEKDGNVYAMAWDPTTASSSGSNKTENDEYSKFKLTLAKGDFAQPWRESFKAERLLKILSSDYAIKFVPGHFGLFTSKLNVAYTIASEKNV
jgi:hypothetical protein